MLPHEASGGCTPRPRKDSDASARIAKAMLRDWEKRYPGRVDTVFAALGRVAPSHLLDRSRHDFQAIGSESQRLRAAGRR